MVAKVSVCSLMSLALLRLRDRVAGCLQSEAYLEEGKAESTVVKGRNI
jgi:hypothetical protein